MVHDQRFNSVLAALFASAVRTTKPRLPQGCRNRCEWHAILANQRFSQNIGWLLAFRDAMPAHPFAEQLNWRRAVCVFLGSYGFEPAKSPVQRFHGRCI